MRRVRRKSFLGGGSNPVTRLSPSFPTAYCLAEPECQQFSTHTKMRRRMNQIFRRIMRRMRMANYENDFNEKVVTKFSDRPWMRRLLTSFSSCFH